MKRDVMLGTDEKGRSNTRKRPRASKKDTEIVIVDDDMDTSIGFKIALQERGYTVSEFTNPLLALEHFKRINNICDLVISDLRMPGMNGLEFSKNIKMINPKAKILLMTAFDINDDIRFASQNENNIINGFIQKPITEEELYAIVHSQLKGKAK
jgi:DNA-binding NtrC family response regulator